MNIAQHLKLSEKLLNKESQRNCKYTRLQVFELVLIFPFFMVKNAFHYPDSSLSKVIPCKKDVFYLSMENGSLDWRMMFCRINRQLSVRYTCEATLSSKDPECLIIDDRDSCSLG